MKTLNKIILILLIPLLAFTTHKYYISLTKIDFIKEKKVVQITMRFFIDDIQSTLENRYEIKLELGTKEENKEADLFLKKYINQKFKITINNKTTYFSYLGKEYENDVVFIYLEINNIENINQIEIQNKMLFEEFPEQGNFIKTNINNSKKTSLLFKGNDKEMLKF
ncbi:MAG: hypothetical protein L3J08_03015 [Flavobacteriaceae bacterium]|nr:hypothetical protein [Flavobacteriaceae bacterium]